MAAKRKKKQKARTQRSAVQRIQDLRLKIKGIEEREAARAVQSEPVYKHLKAMEGSLEKAVGHMDGRRSKLQPDFIRASRQYLNLLTRALEEIQGKKRRGRKPKLDMVG